MAEAITVSKNLYALIENHERGTPQYDENGVWIGGAYPIVCLEGSARSGKTFSWAEYIINVGEQMPGIITSVFRHDAATHEKAAVRDFKRLMIEQYPGVWAAGRWTNKPMQFTHANGSIVEFVGTNDPAKLHGPERDIAIPNEVMEITSDAYKQIAMRTRLMTIMDWNPSNILHWVFDSILTRQDVLYVHSTYKDNPHLTSRQVAEIESMDPSNPVNVRQGTADKWKWEVYGLGKRGKREGTVFELFDITDFWPDPNLCQKWGFGLDFGFSQDPTALVECAIFQGKLYLREWVYERGLVTIRSHAQPNIPSLEGRMDDLKFDRRWKIVADGARPDLIAEMVASGFNVCGQPGGKPRVLARIDLVKRFPMLVHRSSQNLQNELLQYVWRKNTRDGGPMSEPEDNNNHALDGVGYWAHDELAGWQPVRSYQHGGAMAVQGIKPRRY